mmetsp:Transcript_36920/g.61182  ORF Transcript_36920/g.61182 Transcript_36920/m.61182 type:complete len:90 (-) Transcript_36920:360-629(-)|eukprot:CAMPEP_0119313910 /NCGR_PEP_ID=MMETSP1333-20130426/30861_1 /TAXON_ID=418940 /ORGANISM="Scyphosphaera apsteinii, Strain RCC1455" /LENGTH=89 /DNA_ID=CAMNT_0007318889 /DNA_START=143 /DNA_END=412 /DNA_ORIENTATION=+
MFIKGPSNNPEEAEIKKYPEIELKYIPGHNPDLVVLEDEGEGEIERIDLTKLPDRGADYGGTAGISKLLQEKGFARVEPEATLEEQKEL